MSAHVERAHLLLQQSRYEKAEEELRRELAESEGNGVVHAMLALCLSGQEKHKEARVESGQAISLMPDEPFCHYAHAHVCFDGEDYKAARQAINEAIRLFPQDPDYFALSASIFLAQKRWSDAEWAAQEGLRWDPEHVGCQNVRAIALVKQGRKGEAGVTLETALEREPQNAVTHANRGWALLEHGNHSQALISFREALRLDPDLEWAQAGIVEALKARNIVYRLMLKYFFLMSRLSGRAQWGVIIGLYVVYRVVRGLARARPDLAPVLVPLSLLYVLFVLLTWIAHPLFNLLLRLDRFGRYALSADQIKGANGVGLCLLVSIAFATAGLLLGQVSLVIAAFGAAFLVVPVAGAWQMPKGRRRVAMLGYTALLVLCGLGSLGASYVDADAALNLGMVYFLGIILFTWVANAVAVRL